MIDSSVFVKYLTKEEGWQEVEKHLHRPTTLPLALKEIANALRTKTLDGYLSPEHAKDMILKVASMIKPIAQEELMAESFQIAVDHRLTVYDSLFVAAAVRSKEELITCDKRQAEVGRAMNLRVRVV